MSLAMQVRLVSDCIVSVSTQKPPDYGWFCVPGTVDTFTSHHELSLTFGWCQLSIYQHYCYGLIRLHRQGLNHVSFPQISALCC